MCTNHCFITDINKISTDIPKIVLVNQWYRVSVICKLHINKNNFIKQKCQRKFL